MDINQGRRGFIKQLLRNTALVGAGLWLPVPLFGASSTVKKLTILHTNDTHSHIEPFPETDRKYPGMGGVVRRKALIEKIREEEKNVLLLDSGDIFQGTPYFNFFKGEIEFKAMSAMKYDAATIGNHDFDNTVEGLEAMLPHADFDFVIANYDFSNTAMNGRSRPYKIFEKDKIKVGVFGLGIELEGLVAKGCYMETEYIDPIAVAQEYSSKLRDKEKCDLVICLSHLGYKYDHENESEKVSDIKLAAATEGIDLILGGHTHTFLDEPVTVTNAKGKEVLIAQVGFGGIKLGRIDFYFDTKTNGLAWHSTQDSQVYQIG
ncbi:metallophosphatase [Limibacter armeniacum]|uniref:bifunctional metallophosphatase/5'-nucleotidase n=1 Tax=Limibacter armeniacum TaxID=466084 RepID=UPI002FE6B7F5